MPIKVGLGFSAALRFLPLTFERLTLLLQAMEVRSYDFSPLEHRWHPWEWVDYMKRIGVAMPLITIPLLVNPLRATNAMAMVVDARAFGAQKTRGTLKVHNTTLEDKWAWTFYALTIAVVIVLIVTGIAPRSTFG